mmetsp:Transcript_11516/g.27164  ORF Transcript_11516/g.27164 Transcript_11516/m.27164 type:complete len:227 (+) Transcript_11516:54-734(+)
MLILETTILAAKQTSDKAFKLPNSFEHKCKSSLVGRSQEYILEQYSHFMYLLDQKRIAGERCKKNGCPLLETANISKATLQGILAANEELILDLRRQGVLFQHSIQMSLCLSQQFRIVALVWLKALNRSVESILHRSNVLAVPRHVDCLSYKDDSAGFVLGWSHLGLSLVDTEDSFNKFELFLHMAESKVRQTTAALPRFLPRSVCFDKIERIPSSRDCSIKHHRL